MIPIRYWLMEMSELPVADFLNDGNFMFWHPGPEGLHFPLPSHPKGWHKHRQTKKPAYACFPHASYKTVKLQGVRRFIQRRLAYLPRQNGELLVGLKVFDPDTVSVSLAHFRHQGPSSPLSDPNFLTTPDNLPEDLKPWLPKSL